MNQNVEGITACANCNKSMETRNHSELKNGANLKSQMSKRNNLMKILKI